MTRRQILASIPSLLIGALLRPDPLRGAAASHATPMRRRPGRHPEPRPGIDASRILPRDRLEGHPDAIPVFDMVREIPRVVDGIRCQCECDERQGIYSLLSCFEGEGMAKDCMICQGQAQLAHRLHRQGKSLARIRAAIDAEFG